MNDDEPPQQRASRKKTRNVRLSAPGTHTAASAAGIASKTPSTSKPKKYSQPSIFSSCKKKNVNNNVGAPTKSKSVYNPLPHSKERLMTSQVLTIRRANLDEEITSGIMFVKENKQVTVKVLLERSNKGHGKPYSC